MGPETAAGAGTTALLDGPGVVQWPLWTTTARLVLTDPARTQAARTDAQEYLARVEAAASRFRPDSEVRALAAADGSPRRRSPLLAELIAEAMRAARRTGGLVDPTLGADLAALGYDRNLVEVDVDLDEVARSERPPAPPGVPDLHVLRRATWRDVDLRGDVVSVPAGVVLDLGAVAKAHAADALALTLAHRHGCGVMVSLGGDLRVAGPPPSSGWAVLVQDGPGEPACTVVLSGLEAVATSSTLHRTWRRAGRRLHHILDPASGRPARPVWRTVTVAAATCVDANTWSTAGIVAGDDAPDLLTGAGVAARLVAADGRVVRLGGWPA